MNRKQSFWLISVLGLVLFAWNLKNKQASTAGLGANPNALITDEAQYDPKPASLEAWRASLAEDAVFHVVSGLKVTLESGQVWLRIRADDLFESAVVPIHQNYLAVLDQLAVRMIEKEAAGNQIKLTIHIRVKADDPKEFTSSEFGKSRLNLATQRGEWIAHYLERKHGISIQHFSVQGYAEPKAVREIGIQFSSSKSSSS